MTLSSAFTVNSSAQIQAHESSYGATVSLALSSLTGVRTVAWSIDGTSHASMVSPTITPAGTPSGATASFVLPADPGDGQGRSVVVKCLVTGSGGATTASYRVVGVPNLRGLVPVSAGEEGGGEYRSETHGWAEVFNAALAGDLTASFLHYGAVGNGTTDDTAAVTAAIAAGATAGVAITGASRTYGVSGNITLPANTHIVDATFKQLAPAAAGDVRTLTSASGNNIKLVRVKVNRNGNGTNGALDADAGVWISGGSGHHFEDVEVFGDDMGSGFVVTGASNFSAVGVHVHDIDYSLAVSPGDDRVQGIWFNNCSDFVCTGARVLTLGGNFGAGQTTQYSRGVVFGGCTRFVLTESRASDIDQPFDLTGSVGNTRFTLSGCVARNGRAAGFAFKNSARDGVVSGCVAEDCGLAGFHFSGPAESGLAIKTGDITVSNCLTYNTGSNGVWTTDFRPAGFLVEDGAFDPTLSPLGIRFVDCEAIDRQGVPTMKYGFANEIAAGTDGRYNEAVNCRSIGHTTRAFKSMHAPRCSVGLTSAANMGSGAWGAISWHEAAASDDGAMFAGPDTNIYARQDGTYEVSAGIVWAANATGQRGVRILYNGGLVNGTQVLVNAAASGETALSTSARLKMRAGETVRIEMWQSSTVALDIQTTSGAWVEKTHNGPDVG